MAIDDIEIGVQVDRQAFRRGVDDILEQSRRLSKQIKRIGSEVRAEFGIDQLRDSFDIVFSTVEGGIERVLELRDAAQEAGQSLSTFTEGAFTREDVEAAEDFKNAMSDLKDIQAELALEIAPELVTFFREITPAIRLTMQAIGGIMSAGRFLGRVSTDLFFGAQRGIGSGVADLAQFAAPGAVRSNTVAATQARQRAAGVRTSGISGNEGAELVINRTREEIAAFEAQRQSEKRLQSIERINREQLAAIRGGKTLNVKVGANP